MLGLSFTGLIYHEPGLLRPDCPRLLASSTICITMDDMNEVGEETGQKGKPTAPSLLGENGLCLFNQFLTFLFFP